MVQEFSPSSSSLGALGVALRFLYDKVDNGERGRGRRDGNEPQDQSQK